MIRYSNRAILSPLLSIAEPWRDQLRRKASAVIRLWRALTRGGIAAVVFRFAGVLCTIGGIPLLWMSVQQAHSTGFRADSGLSQLGISLDTVGLWFCILSIALVDQSRHDQQNNPIAMPLWLPLSVTVIVTCLTVAEALLLVPGIVNDRQSKRAYRWHPISCWRLR